MPKITIKSSSILLFLLLAITIFLLQQILLAPHLRYGFADVDWGFLLQYKQLNGNPLLNIFSVWRTLGVYTYQAYYIGILEHFFPIDGFNFINIHIATHFFKFLSAITLFPLILILTGKKLLAVLTTIIYAITFSAVGPLYTVVVSGHYVAITVMNLFLLYYCYIVKNNKTGLLWLSGWLILFIITLFLSPERMYPLGLILPAVEIFLLWIKKYPKNALVNYLKRMILIFSPLMIILFSRIFMNTNYFGDVVGFSSNTQVILQKISQGNWQLILNPLISLTSLFFPNEYWGLVGSNQIAITSFGEFVGSLSQLFFFFLLFSIVLGIFVSKKLYRFVLLILIINLVGSTIVFIVASHYLSVDISFRLHYDTFFLKPTIVGVFLLSWSLSVFYEWVINKKKDVYLLSISTGLIFAFIFIFLTWLPSDYAVIFTGAHRYLVIPAIGSSLTIAALIGLIYEKIRNISSMKNFAFLVLLVLIPITQMNFSVVSKYFDYWLNVAGTDGAAHALVKNKLLVSLGDFNFHEPSLFYFDEWPPDPLYGYFHETTIISGFETWVMFKGKSKPLNGIRPVFIRNASLCPKVVNNCFIKLKDFVTARNGKQGILYQNVFYSKEYFFAFRLKNKDIFDIKPEVTVEIGLN